MTTKPSPAAERIMALQIGKSCVVGGNGRDLVKTAKRHLPHARFSTSGVDGQFVITRTA